MRPLLRLRHFGRLVVDVVGYAYLNRTWWLLPLMAALAVVTVFIVVGQAAAPYTISAATNAYLDAMGLEHHA